MPTNIKIIHSEDFIRATPAGVLDLRESRGLLKNLVAALDMAGRYHVLLDTRGANVHLSTIDLYELGKALAAEPALQREKVALLVSPAAKLQADFFENVSHNWGANLKAFIHFEPAVEWLIMEERR